MALGSLQDGRVLMVGGSLPSGPALAEAFLFDPVTNQWAATTKPHFARSGASAVVLPDGRVLVAGGGPLESEVYDPATATWSDDASLNSPHSTGMGMLLLKSGQVLLAGGYTDTGPTTVSELYGRQSSLSIEAPSPTFTYGASIPTVFTPNYVGLVNGDTAPATPPTCTTTARTGSPVGTYPVTCSGASDPNYSITYLGGTLSIRPAPLTVVAPSVTFTYGDAIPATFTPTYVGLVNGDTQPATPATCTSTAHTGSGVGTYPIVCSGASDLNYTISYASAPVTVTPVPLTVIVNSVTETYGGGVPAPTYSGLVNGDIQPATPPTCTSSTGVGTNTITCVGGSDPNYTITYSIGTLTISPAPLKVVAPSVTFTYGDAIPATFTPTYIGLVNGDTAPATPPTCTSPGYTGSNAGPYPITCSGASDANYTISYVAGVLTITKAPLTVMADDESMMYGGPMPTLTYQISGFVLGQTLPTSGVSGAASCSTGATVSSASGTYPSTCTIGSLAAANYAFPPGNFRPGTLTITKRSATLGYTGTLFFSTGSSTATTANVTLQGLLNPATGGSPDLTKASPVFLLYKSTNLTMASPDQTCSATVSTTGAVSCTISLGLDNWTVILSLPATDPYVTAPNADPVVLTVYQPTSGIFATGGGWIVDPSYQNKPVAISASNNHGNFGFNVRYKSGTTTPQGQSVCVFRGADGYDYVIKSNSWQGGAAAFTPTTASFSGKASVIVVNPLTGMVVSGLGGGNYTYRVDVTSASTPTYAISVYDSTGALYHQAGTTGTQIPLGGGNIVVHH